MEGFWAAFWIVYLLVNAGLSSIVAYVAGQRGRSKGGFFALSFFVSFLVALIVVIALPALPASMENHQNSGPTSAEKAICPFCKEEVKNTALICKHCGSDITEAMASDREAKVAETSRLAALANQQRKQEAEAFEAAKLRDLAEKEREREQTKAFLKSRKFFMIVGGVLVAIALVVMTSVITNNLRIQAIEDEWKKTSVTWQKVLSDCSKLPRASGFKFTAKISGREIVLAYDSNADNQLDLVQSDQWECISHYIVGESLYNPWAGGSEDAARSKIPKGAFVVDGKGTYSLEWQPGWTPKFAATNEPTANRYWDARITCGAEINVWNQGATETNSTTLNQFHLWSAKWSADNAAPLGRLLPGDKCILKSLLGESNLNQTLSSLDECKYPLENAGSILASELTEYRLSVYLAPDGVGSNPLYGGNCWPNP